MSDEYVNIRELLPVEGQRVVMVTQHDETEWMAGSPAYFSIHFDSGLTLTVEIHDDLRVRVVMPR